MDFLKLFLRSVSLLPSLIQSVEALYGAKSGAQKKDAALAIVSSSLNLADAVTAKQIADAPKFTAGLAHRRRRGRMPQRQPLGESSHHRVSAAPTPFVPAPFLFRSMYFTQS